MKKLLMTAIASMLLTGAAVGGTINFDDTQVGELPSGWKGGVTGKGTPKWAVIQDATAPSKPNVLKQSGQGPYPWWFKTRALLNEGFVEVKFKPLSGKEDQAGGLIWRWQDSDNY